jgi:hypothetical protein
VEDSYRKKLGSYFAIFILYSAKKANRKLKDLSTLAAEEFNCQ